MSFWYSVLPSCLLFGIGIASLIRLFFDLAAKNGTQFFCVGKTVIRIKVWERVLVSLLFLMGAFWTTKCIAVYHLSKALLSFELFWVLDFVAFLILVMIRVAWDFCNDKADNLMEQSRQEPNAAQSVMFKAQAGNMRLAHLGITIVGVLTLGACTVGWIYLFQMSFCNVVLVVFGQH